jgi:acyl-CoA thioesterase I
VRRALCRLCRALALAALVLVPVGTALADETDECEVPRELRQDDAALPHLAARLKEKQPVTIVAIGGASTAGAAAGSSDFAYPARLRDALLALFPGAQVRVVNKGVPRQSAQQQFERFPSDVMAEDPVLVIWETGTVDAVHDIQIDDFAGALQHGIDELKNRAIDIILVDMQFSHSTAAMIDFPRYLETLHRIGDVNGIYVFPRFAMMKYWSEQNVFNFDGVAAGERAKLAARVYDCIGRRLARSIRQAIP